MARRLLALLLNAAVVFSVVGGACPARAACMMERGPQGNCCAGPRSGISAPRCCNGIQQLSRTGFPAATERQRHEGGAHLAVGVVPAPAVDSSVRVVATRSRPDYTSAPPGGTLIAQHTSLLL